MIQTSDHRCISFNLQLTTNKIEEERLVKNTGWDFYGSCLKADLDSSSVSLLYRNISEIELGMDRIYESILNTYHEACPTSRISEGKYILQILVALRTKTRRAFNNAMKNRGEPVSCQKLLENKEGNHKKVKERGMDETLHGSRWDPPII